jgi:hypothetical protein
MCVAGAADEGNMLASETVENLRLFADYARSLEGDEKGEAQVFCDRLFRAFGHEGYKEADATLASPPGRPDLDLRVEL